MHVLKFHALRLATSCSKSIGIPNTLDSRYEQQNKLPYCTRPTLSLEPRKFLLNVWWTYPCTVRVDTYIWCNFITRYIVEVFCGASDLKHHKPVSTLKSLQIVTSSEVIKKHTASNAAAPNRALILLLFCWSWNYDCSVFVDEQIVCHGGRNEKQVSETTVTVQYNTD